MQSDQAELEQFYRGKVYEETAPRTRHNNPSEETIFRNNKIKEQY